MSESPYCNWRNKANVRFGRPYVWQDPFASASLVNVFCNSPTVEAELPTQQGSLFKDVGMRDGGGMNLQLNVATAYVLPCSSYAGRSDEVERVEMVRKAAGAKEMPARANIVVKKEVHECRAPGRGEDWRGCYCEKYESRCGRRWACTANPASRV